MVHGGRSAVPCSNAAGQDGLNNAAELYSLAAWCSVSRPSVQCPLVSW